MKRLFSLVMVLAMVLTVFSFNVVAEEEVYEGFKIEDSEFTIAEEGNEELSNLKFYLLKWMEETEEGHTERAMNVIKLRDLAKALKETEGKFDVVWNEEEKTVELVKGGDYEPNGNEYAPVDFETAVIYKADNALTVDGEEAAINSWMIDGENYVQITTFVKEMGNMRYFSDFEDGTVNYIAFDETDVEAFDKTEFEELLAEKDYTVIFSWGPWCYWSKLAVPRMVKAAETLETDYPNAQIFGLIHRYTDYRLEDLEKLNDGKEYPFVQKGGTDEAYKFFEDEVFEEEGALNWFPKIFIINKDAELVGVDFGSVWDEVEEAFAEEHGLDIEEEWEEDVWTEFYDSIFPAFFEQITKDME